MNRSRIIIGTFFGEGVTMFFFILGFFYFNQKSFKKMCHRVLVSILLPVFVYLLFASIFGNWIVGKATLTDCIRALNVHTFDNMIHRICGLNIGKIKCAPHLWYIFPYVQCILWFPLLRYVGKDNKARYFLEVMGVMSLFLSDIQTLFHFPVEFGTYSIITVPVLELLIGYELYMRRNIFLTYKWQSRVIGLIDYFAFHMLHGYINIWGKTGNLKIRFAWDSVIDIIQATGIAVFFLSFTFKGKQEQTINFIASHTFWIYLIHWSVIKRLKFYGVKEWFYKLNGGSGANVVGEILYTLEFTVFVFGLSLFITILLKTGLELLKYIIEKILYTKSKICNVQG